MSEESTIQYFQTKAFEQSLQKAFFQGGIPQKRAGKVKQILGSLAYPNPFQGFSVTNHGENRINNCVKYDLGDGWRLITTQDARTCTFVFVGNHADSDRWLNAHRGEAIAVRDKRLVRVPGVAIDFEPSGPTTAGPSSRLLDLMPSDLLDDALNGLPASIMRKLDRLETTSTTAEIHQLLEPVSEVKFKEFVTSILLLLRNGDVDGAQAHIDLRLGRSRPLEAEAEGDFIDVLDGEDVRRLNVGSKEYERWLLAFERRTSWYAWVLFLHPAQERVVTANHPGAAQLSGVSGSGKTCVIVRRAMRLAESSTGRVLLLTLNRSLAGLLQQLVDGVCVDDDVHARIKVSSFFDLAREILMKFEPERARYYEDITWKLGEHVDEIFREFYRKWTNNTDSAPLDFLHRTMTARGISGECYLRDELDWIRSSVAATDRDRYLTIERRGRRFPIPEDRRRDLLAALTGWERKMRAVGVVDYLGLTTALGRHLSRLSPQFDHILVDESQDFGTTELRIVRQLVSPGPNDIFLCGDVAQTVLPKHRSLPEAGITGVTRERIRQNYRNSREILRAAHDLLVNNLYEEIFDGDGLEILDPRFANFSGPSPTALATDSLEEEIGFARSYAQSRLDQGVKTVCIAFAGYSARDIGIFAVSCDVPVLNGAYDPSTHPLVFSDLEQTKGYEFETRNYPPPFLSPLPAP